LYRRRRSRAVVATAILLILFRVRCSSLHGVERSKIPTVEERFDELVRQGALYAAARLAGSLIARRVAPEDLARLRTEEACRKIRDGLEEASRTLGWFIRAGQSWNDDEIMLAIVKRLEIAEVLLAVQESGAPVEFDLTTLDAEIDAFIEATHPRSASELTKRWARDPIFMCRHANLGPLGARAQSGERRRS
jgi:hypothetical protein